MDIYVLLPIHSFPYSDIMSTDSRILKLLSKLTTRLNFSVAKSADPTPSLPQTRRPSLPSDPIITHVTLEYDHHSQRRYVSLASATTRGWRIPRFVHRRSPERHDRHSVHCIAAGILFSAVKLAPGAKRRARNAWNCNTRLTKPSPPKEPASEILESDVPILISIRDQLSSHLTTVGEIRGKAVLNDHTPIHEDLAGDCRGDADDWTGNHPMSEGWISMKPIIGKA
jgi:hypothetical protein